MQVFIVTFEATDPNILKGSVYFTVYCYCILEHIIILPWMLCGKHAVIIFYLIFTGF